MVAQVILIALLLVAGIVSVSVGCGGTPTTGPAKTSPAPEKDKKDK